MKKLLILGGSKYIVPVINKAHKLGIYVITADYLPNNYAHKYSDEYVNVSIVDRKKVLKVAKELKIDGIMSFACDPGVITMAYVANKLGLPCVGSYKSVTILQDKGKFRSFLKRNNFNVPFAKTYSNINKLLKDSENFIFPLIVKPVDSAGSKGVSKVNSKNELNDAFFNALKFSKKKKIIIEEFLEKSGCSSDYDCYSENGVLSFCKFSSQYFDVKCENEFTPSAFYSEATFCKGTKQYLYNEIQRLISLLKLDTSVYNIETRECTNGRSYIMEVSPRGGGNRLSEMLEYSTGIDLISEYIKFCVGLKNVDSNRFTPKFDKKIAEIILHSSKEGVFDSLYLSDIALNHLIETDLWIDQGTVVGPFKGANEAIGTLVLNFNNDDEWNEFYKNIDSNIIVKLRSKI